MQGINIIIIPTRVAKLCRHRRRRRRRGVPTNNKGGGKNNNYSKS